MSAFDLGAEPGGGAQRLSARDWPGESRHLSDYLRVLRERWRWAAAAFCLVAGFLAWRGLYGEPVYESLGTLQMEDQGRNDTLLSELGIHEGGTNVDAELLVMTSLKIARQAAALGGLCAHAEQRNGYRPLEGVLRSFGLLDPPTIVRTSAEPLTPPERERHYLVQVSPDGATATFRRAPDGPELLAVPLPKDRPLGVALEGHPVELAFEGHPPAGRLFDLRLFALDQAAALIQEHVVAREEGRKTGVITLGYKGPSPHRAQQVARAVHAAYLEHKSERRKSSLRERLAWLGAEKERVKGDLERAESVLDEYIRHNGAVLLGERALAGLQEQGRIVAQRLEQEQALKELEARLQDLEAAQDADRIQELLGPVSADASMVALATSLTTLELERRSLLTQGRTEADPQVKQLKASIDETRRLLEDKSANRKAHGIDLLKRQLTGVRERIGHLEAEYQRQEERLKALPLEEREIAQRTRDVDASSRVYEMLTRWEGEARIALQSTGSPVAPVDAPALPIRRSEPLLWRTAALALLLGLFCAFFAAFARNYFDRTIGSPEDLERATGLALYAAIPHFQTVRRRERRAIRRSHHGQLPTLSAPHSVVAETYRTLRANLRFASVATPIKTLAITSAVDQEGKSLTTLNLAVVMAQAGSKTVVVDADMRRPSTHQVLGTPVAPGLSDVLQGRARWADALQTVAGLDNFHLIPAGPTPENPGALLDSPPLKALMDELSTAYDYVLFDVPPVLVVADAAAFLRRLDAVLLLNRARRATAEVVDGARQQIQRTGGNVVGTIFNAFDARAANRRGYYGYYGYYGAYGRYHASDTSAPTSAPTP